MESICVTKRETKKAELKDDVLLQIKLGIEDAKAGRVKRVR